MKLDFSMNPVALRELRQLVRSRVITWCLAIFPAILFGFTMLAVSSASRGASPMEMAFGDGIGDKPFVMVSVITGLVACLGIPFYAAMKAILETGRNGPGLEFTTALTPARIVGGRLTAAAILIAAAVASAMPFFMFAYLLRGVPLEQVFLVPFSLFCYGFGLFAVSLVIACRQSHVALRILMTVALFFVTLIAGNIPILAFSSHTSMARAPSYTMLAFWFSTILVAIVVLVRAYCASQLAPRHVDAERPFRHVLMALFLLSALAAIAYPEPWCITWTVIGSILVMQSALSPREMPRAARAAAPKSFIGRLVSFPFSTGATPGVLFAFFITAVAGITYTFISGNKDHVCTLWACVAEVTFLPVIAGAIMRTEKARESRFRLVGWLIVAYVVAIHFLVLMCELDYHLRANSFALIPCNFPGIVEKPQEHLYTFGIGLIMSVSVAVITSVKPFKGYRRPQ